MSFQNPNQPRKQKPTLEHSFLTKKGPKLVTIKSVPQVIISKKDQKKYHLLTIELAGIDYTYFIPNRDIEDKLKQHVGKTVVITATGNTKRGTATMEIQAAMVKASTLDKPVVAHKPTAEPIKNPEPKDPRSQSLPLSGGKPDETLCEEGQRHCRRARPSQRASSGHCYHPVHPSGSSGPHIQDADQCLQSRGLGMGSKQG
jgi:hypothetical protein